MNENGAMKAMQFYNGYEISEQAMKALRTFVKRETEAYRSYGILHGLDFG